MATNFSQTGFIIEVTAAAVVSSGDGVLVGTLFGVANADAKIGETVNIHTTGVWTLPKTSAQAWTVGAAIYWDGTACTTTVSTNTLIGKAVAVAANPSATGVVRLNG